MKEQMKLRILIPHWIEHNQEHAQEFMGYSEAAGDAAVHLQEAAEQMERVNQALAAALKKLGGALAHEHGHTHHM